MLRKVTSDLPRSVTQIQRVNRKDWWHLPPVDSASYSTRGKFFSSTYREIEFWRRPNNVPERVNVKHPLI